MHGSDTSMWVLLDMTKDNWNKRLSMRGSTYSCLLPHCESSLGIVPGSARPINSIAMLGWGPSHTLKHHTRKCSIEGVNIYLPETTEEGQYTKFSMQSSWGHPSNGDTPPYTDCCARPKMWHCLQIISVWTASTGKGKSWTALGRVNGLVNCRYFGCQQEYIRDARKQSISVKPMMISLTWLPSLCHRHNFTLPVSLRTQHSLVL